MSKAASTPRRRSSKSKPRAAKGKAGSYLPDRIVGGVSLLVDLVGVALLASGAFFAAKGGKPADHTSGLILGLVALWGVFVVFVDANVFRSRRWAFVASALIAAVSLSGERLHLGPHLLVSTRLWMLVYGVLRAIPVFGPKPR